MNQTHGCSAAVRGRASLLVTALALTLLPAAARAQTWRDVQRPTRPLVLKAQGSFFVDGDSVATDAARLPLGPTSVGQINVNQMYVQFQIPDGTIRHTPVVMVHGCCLSSKTWETTPDGRMGWAEYFVRDRRPVYLAEQVSRARSGFNATIINQVKIGAQPATALPSVLMGTHEFAWSVFRFGPSYGVAWPDEQFPLEKVNQLYNQMIPDFNSTLRPDSNPTWANMASLARQLGGAILMGHSESSTFPSRAALIDPTGVRGIVQLETGCLASVPTDTLTADQYAVLAKIPILVVYGDHPAVPQPTPQCVTWVQKINAAGGDAKFIWLPAVGLRGNSHMFMQDRNNLDVADVILDWIDEHVDHTRRGGRRTR